MQARWLRLRDAARYASIGKHRLIALAERGEVRGFKDPDSGWNEWIFDRKSLDRYRERQIAESQSHRIDALDIMEGLY